MGRETQHPSRLTALILASRPKTLPAAIMPVLVGSAMAVHDGQFRVGAALAALICALLIQIGTNYSNDLLDYRSGMDTEERTGPERAVASGWLSEVEMLQATIVVFVLTVPLGLYLIAVAGWPVLIIGLASLGAGISYTGGPYPLAYHGLGDLFVFLFFGLVATAGTYYVQAVTVNWFIILTALAPGALITNILVVNNYRDIPTDRATGKRTLAVILGPAGTRMEYILLLLLSYSVPLILFLTGEFTWWVLLPWLTLPFALSLSMQLMNENQGKVLNKVLARTAALCLIFGILLSLGVML